MEGWRVGFTDEEPEESHLHGVRVGSAAERRTLVFAVARVMLLAASIHDCIKEVTLASVIVRSKEPSRHIISTIFIIKGTYVVRNSSKVFPIFFITSLKSVGVTKMCGCALKCVFVSPAGKTFSLTRSM